MRWSWLLLFTSACWPYLPGSYDEYLDTSDTGDVAELDTEADSDADTSDVDTEPDTEADTDADTEPSGIQDVDIDDLRQGRVASGTQVRVRNVVVTSPQLTNGFWVQMDSSQAFSGIYVYDGTVAAPSVSEGTLVTITGEFMEFTSGTGSLAEIVVRNSADIVLPGGSRALPAASLVDHDDIANTARAQQYENNLVELGPSVVTIGPDGFGQFYVEPVGGGDQVAIDDIFYSANPSVGDTFTSIRGILNFAHGEFKIEPRRAEDIPFGSSNTGCGAELCADDLLPGEVFVSEIAYNPAASIGEDAGNEFVEIYNNSGTTVNLDGLVLTDNVGIETIYSTTVVPAGGYAVIARAGGGWGWPVGFDGTYGTTVSFSNSTAEYVTLSNVSGTLDTTSYYTTWSSGRTWSLDTSTGYGADAVWCTATSTSGSWDNYGTPGAPNDSCTP